MPRAKFPPKLSLTLPAAGSIEAPVKGEALGPFVINLFGALFSWLVTGLAFAAIAVAGVFWVYSRDLPGYEYLANYTPKTISRIYSGEGRLMDEFAIGTADFCADRG